MSKLKVVPRIFGGLGNQLFIYAAARRLALVNDAELVLDDVSGFIRDYDYRRHYQLNHFKITGRKATTSERLEPFSRVRRYVLRHWNKGREFDQRNYIRQEGNDFEPRLLQLRLSGTLYLEGYWQSEQYFKDVEMQIRDELCIQPPGDMKNQLMVKAIRSRSAVAVHVRFFDPVSQFMSGEEGNNATSEYYNAAINLIEQLVPNAHYFIFSDQPQVALSIIRLPQDRITLVDHNQGDLMAYADLWLMTNCRHFIIANSTFSWWGAWLARNPEKIVISPGFQKRDGKMSWGFAGLIPESWIKL